MTGVDETLEQTTEQVQETDIDSQETVLYQDEFYSGIIETELSDVRPTDEQVKELHAARRGSTARSAFFVLGASLTFGALGFPGYFLMESGFDRKQEAQERTKKYDVLEEESLDHAAELLEGSDKVVMDGETVLDGEDAADLYNNVLDQVRSHSNENHALDRIIGEGFEEAYETYGDELFENLPGGLSEAAKSITEDVETGKMRGTLYIQSSSDVEELDDYVYRLAIWHGEDESFVFEGTSDDADEYLTGDSLYDFVEENDIDLGTWRGKLSDAREEARRRLKNTI